MALEQAWAVLKNSGWRRESFDEEQSEGRYNREVEHGPDLVSLQAYHDARAAGLEHEEAEQQATNAVREYRMGLPEDHPNHLELKNDASDARTADELFHEGDL